MRLSSEIMLRVRQQSLRRGDLSQICAVAISALQLGDIGSAAPPAAARELEYVQPSLDDLTWDRLNEFRARTGWPLARLLELALRNHLARAKASRRKSP